jgi:hypothetical protein
MVHPYGSAVILRFLAVLFAYVILSSSSSARVLPKIKRNNSTCCGYKITNQGNALFRYESITEFDKVRIEINCQRVQTGLLMRCYQMTSIDQVYQAGWTVSDKWKVGGSNSASGRAQYSTANEKNVRIVTGVGLTLTLPGGEIVCNPVFECSVLISATQ